MKKMLLFITLTGITATGIYADTKNSGKQNAKGGSHKSFTVKQVTSGNFEEVVLKATKPVVIDFYGIWCAPCKQMKPTFEKFAEENKEKYLCVAVNIDNAQDVAAAYNVTVVPTFVVIKDSVHYGSFTGVLPQEELAKEIEKALATKPEKTEKVAALPKLSTEQQGMLLLQAVSSNNIDLLTTLIKDGANVNHVISMTMPTGKDKGKKFEFTPLSIAAGYANENMVTLLLDAGADIDQKFLNTKGKQVTVLESLEDLIVDITENIKNMTKLFDSYKEKAATTK